MYLFIAIAHITVFILKLVLLFLDVILYAQIHDFVISWLYEN